jgi:hypothetical protein
MSVSPAHRNHLCLLIPASPWHPHTVSLPAGTSALHAVLIHLVLCGLNVTTEDSKFWVTSWCLHMIPFADFYFLPLLIN